MRTAAKRDLAEPAIIEALENVGCKVVQLNDRDVADLIVVNYRTRSLLLMEVKTGNAPLRPGQEKFIADMAKHGVKVHVVRTPREALDAIEFTWGKP